MAIWRPTEDLRAALATAEQDIVTARDYLLREFRSEQEYWLRSSAKRRRKTAAVSRRLSAANKALAAIQEARQVIA